MIAASLFDGDRLTMRDALDLTRRSLLAYGADYRHWALAFSGGKDSTAAVTVLCRLLDTGAVPRPESLTVLYADTRQELPPLHASALAILGQLDVRGIRTVVVRPPLKKRFLPYILGRGVPPPNNNTLRWCTRQIKVDPMLAALADLRAEIGEKLLMLTGVRMGESAVRDARIALSCSKDGAECGQGWFQQARSEAIADTLAPLLHWRVCHVWDWLTLEAPADGFKTTLLANVYGGDEAAEIGARTGCIGCPLASEDRALDGLIARRGFEYLAPLKRLKPLYRELRQFGNRLQKNGERNKGGELSAHPMRKGPLTLAARADALERILAIQREVNAGAPAGALPVDILNVEEEACIRGLIAAGTWPDGWDGTEARGDVLLPETMRDGSVQDVLFAGLGSEVAA